MKTIVWNMAQKASNWDVLEHDEELRGADIALLCEAPPPQAPVEPIGNFITLGLDVSLPPEKPVSRPWSTAVAGRHSLREITDARVDRYYGELLPFVPSRPGTWTAALVDVDGVKVTAISVYGLMDERSDASVHRSLSELSPIFDHKEYGKRLVLGGDLNILAGRPLGTQLDRHQAVLARIRAYGLIDCLEKKRPHGALDGCPCGLGDDCTHTWTKFDPRSPTVAYQDDYLFASRVLARRLTTCRALPIAADSPSDHAPIVATFDV
jgi:endonuclease/exonuclease/phosphatase family metal-dependent hydrolase